MTGWSARASEEANLLNPAFCSLVLSSAIGGYAEVGGCATPFALSFLVLPIALHKATREALPRAVSTSVATWVESHPALLLRFPDRARSLVSFTKEAILFGSRHQAIRIDEDGSLENDATLPRLKRFLSEATDEVRDCLGKGRFLGRWFAKAGNPATVMALWGVAP